MLVRLRNVTLYVKKTGCGNPLILLHGNGEDHAIFDVLVNKLKHHFTCYQVDSRNHGRSAKTNIFNYEQMAEDIKELAQVLNIQNASLLGFSDGGIIGLILGREYPSLFHHMIICGANIHPRGLIKKVREDLMKTYGLSKNPYLKMMIEQPNMSFKDLHSVNIPMLIVAGEHDVIMVRHTKAIARHLPKSTLVVLKEKHHDDYIVNRDDLYELCLTFFNS